jgi:hypothetical protein
MKKNILHTEIKWKQCHDEYDECQCSLFVTNDENMTFAVVKNDEHWTFAIVVKNDERPYRLSIMTTTTPTFTSM